MRPDPPLYILLSVSITPTGAAILAQYASGVQSLSSIAVEQSGYGAGSQSFEHRPNVVRVLIRDVSIVPATMKKGRPGHLVKVVCKPADAQRVARRLAEETGTLGVRESEGANRWIANREVETVTIDVAGETYAVDVKIASDDHGRVFDVSAAYEDAALVGDETGLAVRDVIRRAEAVVRNLKDH